MYKIVFCFFFLLLTACSGADSNEQRLEAALEFAGDNRGELEKVLEHYQADTLKLKAAKFLIRNMPHWYSYEGCELDSAKALLAQIAHNKELGQNSDIKSKWLSYSYYSLPKVYDAQVIKATYLIDHIDHAFKAWKGRSWNNNLGFDDFCELLLPYRIADEPLSDWRPLYEKYYANFLDSAYHGNDVLEACQIINNELRRQDCKFFSKISVPHYDATFLYHNRTGYCRENCDLGLYAMRACGIPVASEYFKYSPDYQSSHQWLTVRDTTGIYIQFGYDKMRAQREVKQQDGRKKGKVYRYCFGEQEQQKNKYEEVINVPTGLGNLYQKDVTANYFGKNRVWVPVESHKDKPVFLGVFSTKGWIPIDMGWVKAGKAVFENIEPNVIYMPLVYNDNHMMEVAGYPFVYEASSKRCRLLKSKGKKWQKMSLYRKMPLRERDRKWLYQGILGTRIEASEDSTFSNPALLYEFKDTLDYCNFKIPIDNKRKFRYIRYTVAKDTQIELAGLGIFQDTLCRQKISLRLLTPIDARYEPQRITDDDMVTAFESSKDLNSLVFEMEYPTHIKCIDFYPRTDCNYVWAGDQYELFYQDGVNGWKSLGVKTATGRSIDFEGPNNVVYWLRDLTTGVEEQIFLYRDGKQQFVYDM